MVAPNQQAQSIEDLIEGWLNAIRMMEQTFQARNIAFLCQSNALSQTERAKLEELQAEVAAWKTMIDAAVIIA